MGSRQTPEQPNEAAAIQALKRGSGRDHQMPDPNVPIPLPGPASSVPVYDEQGELVGTIDQSAEGLALEHIAECIQQGMLDLDSAIESFDLSDGQVAVVQRYLDGGTMETTDDLPPELVIEYIKNNRLSETEARTLFGDETIDKLFGAAQEEPAPSQPPPPAPEEPTVTPDPEVLHVEDLVDPTPYEAEQHIIETPENVANGFYLVKQARETAAGLRVVDWVIVPKGNGGVLDSHELAAVGAAYRNYWEKEQQAIDALETAKLKAVIEKKLGNRILVQHLHIQMGGKKSSLTPAERAQFNDVLTNYVDGWKSKYQQLNDKQISSDRAIQQMSHEMRIIADEMEALRTVEPEVVGFSDLREPTEFADPGVTARVQELSAIADLYERDNAVVFQGKKMSIKDFLASFGGMVDATVDVNAVEPEETEVSIAAVRGYRANTMRGRARYTKGQLGRVASRLIEAVQKQREQAAIDYLESDPDRKRVSGFLVNLVSESREDSKAAGAVSAWDLETVASVLGNGIAVSGESYDLVSLTDRMKASGLTRYQDMNAQRHLVEEDMIGEAIGSAPRGKLVILTSFAAGYAFCEKRVPAPKPVVVQKEPPKKKRLFGLFS